MCTTRAAAHGACAAGSLGDWAYADREEEDDGDSSGANATASEHPVIERLPEGEATRMMCATPEEHAELSPVLRARGAPR